MRAVNLLPDPGKQPRSGSGFFTTTVAAIGGGVVLAAASALVAVAFLQASGGVSDRQARLDTVHQQVANVQAEAARIAAASGEAGDDQSRVNAFTAAAASRIAWDRLLNDVSRVLPKGTWFKTLDAQPGTPEPATGGTAITEPPPTAFVASGVALTQVTVARTMQRLALVPALSNVTLQQSGRTTVGETQAFEYTLSANVLPPEVPR